MQGKPMAHLSNFKTADEERYWVLASERSEENAKLRARLATYEAALREIDDAANNQGPFTGMSWQQVADIARKTLDTP